MTAAAVKCFSSRYCALLIFVTLMPHTDDNNGHSPQLTSCSSVPSPFDPNLTHRRTLAQCTRAGRVQARPHGVPLSAQPSTPVPRRPLPVCLQCRLQTTSLLYQPRSSRRALPSSQQLGSAGFFCGRPCDMELVTRQSERSGHQQRLLQAFTEDVFIFSLLVYIAH